MKNDPGIGLCSTCRHVHIAHSARGSRFYRCLLATADRRFVKYPALPVLQCPGYEAASPGAAACR